MWNYSEKVKDHFFSPRNAKQVENANALGDVGSISCGDALRLTLKINPDDEVILDAGFQTFGCGSAIASSSALTELIIGKTLKEAATLTNQDIANYLDGLPPEKMHCSVMGMEALHAAIADYRGEAIAEDHEEGQLICKCFAIDDELIKRVVKANQLRTLEEVIQYTKAGGACASCHEKIEWVLAACLTDNSPSVTRTPEKKVKTYDTTPVTKKPLGSGLLARIRIIEQVIAEIRPTVQADGGDIQLSDLEDDMVFVNLSGACTGCGLSGATLAMLETKLCAALNETITVYPVGMAQATGGLA